MRIAAVLALVLAATTAAHADDGFDWDPPPPAQWTFHAAGIIQGKPAHAPFAGLGVGLDHRLDGRVWGGFLIASLLGREFEEPGTDMPLPPLQTATFVAATARVQLGEWEEDADRETFWFGWEARGELGTAFVTKERMRSTPAIGSIGLTGFIGARRTRFAMSLGYAFTFAGSQSEIEPGGVDVRLGLTRAW